MRRLSLVAAVSIAALTPGYAFAQQVPPTTVNSPQSTNNGVSNPVGQNTNVQVNNSYAGMNSFGVGIECATPYLAAGVFNNNTSVGSAISGASGSSNNSLGATLQYVVPVGGKQQSNCTALSNEIVHQHQLDTQITLIQRCADFAKAGIKLDARVYPEIAAACEGVHVAMTSTPASAQLPIANSASLPATAAAAPAQQQPIAVPKLVVYREPAPAPATCPRYAQPTARERSIAEAIKSMRGKVSSRRAAEVAKQLAQLRSACVSPVALARLLAGR